MKRFKFHATMIDIETGDIWFDIFTSEKSVYDNFTLYPEIAILNITQI